MRLIVRDLACSRGDEPVFAGVDFSVGAGEGLAVTGPNGAGKSTLLRAIGGLLRPASGEIVLEGAASISSASHFISPLNAMKPALTVGENLAFWQGFAGGEGSPIAQALSTLGVGHLQGVPFGQLSTGQKRRASLARLLVNARRLWLLDEPTSGLDSQGEALFAELLRAHLAGGGLFVAATHLPLGVAGVRTLRFQARDEVAP